ncbi:NADPH-dependent oxidoreductase [Neobacillus sp. DY30]|uniref:NADPH-dependent oxidoreductase n=1 Tax=Neobacillus sp. DY30 TaxID=3047871 RepID=UPI0024BF97D1|nr:NADPH-dependent oxidoreductase [Neobacillus sp. DY30]WHX98411.1 NADPH-dependent oxidoreductase [Neobacillus sp. DY30]
MKKKEQQMNQVIETMLSHRSIRKYSQQPVSNEDLDIIIRSAQAAPSWVNGQHVTIISIKDPDRRKKMSELAGNQKHIIEAPIFLVFCADFHRIKVACEMEGIEFKAAENPDLLLVGTIDVGIALGNAITAAESLGLGTVPIGGIRRSPLEYIELLNLPEYVIPVTGLCIGYPSEIPDLVPRLPKAAVFHEETYKKNIHEEIKTFNQIHIEATKGRQSGGSTWTQRMANFYKDPFYVNDGYKNVGKMLKQQGFAKSKK